MAIDVGKMINAAAESALEDLKGSRRKRLLTPGRAVAVGAAIAAAGRAGLGPVRRFVEERLSGEDEQPEAEADLEPEGEAEEEPEAEAEEEEPEADEDEEPEGEMDEEPEAEADEDWR